MAPDTRERIVGAAAELFRRGGYAGVGVKAIARQSGCPVGSMYHFFPGGKDELVAEALRMAGHGYLLLVEAVLENEPDLVSGIRACFAGAGAVLAATDYADACPIETVALEVASTNEPLRLVTAEIFEGWIMAATSRFAAGGVPQAAARPLAIAFIAALEGAFVLSRALKSTEPLLAAGDATVAALQAALDPDHKGERP